MHQTLSKFNLLAIIGIFICAFTLGCGGLESVSSKNGDNASTSNPDADQTKEDLFQAIEGTWRTPCLPSSSLTFLPPLVREAFGSARNTMFVTDSETVSLRMQIYSDSSCGSLVGTLNSISFINAVPDPQIQGRWRIDSTTISGTFTVHNIVAATAANILNLFAYTDWASGVARPILGRAIIPGFHPVLVLGGRLFTIMEVQSTQIFMGENDVEYYNGTTVERRHNTIDPTPWTRI